SNLIPASCWRTRGRVHWRGTTRGLTSSPFRLHSPPKRISRFPTYGRPIWSKRATRSSESSEILHADLQRGAFFGERKDRFLEGGGAEAGLGVVGHAIAFQWDADGVRVHFVVAVFVVQY